MVVCIQWCDRQPDLIGVHCHIASSIAIEGNVMGFDQESHKLTLKKSARKVAYSNGGNNAK